MLHRDVHVAIEAGKDTCAASSKAGHSRASGTCAWTAKRGCACTCMHNVDSRASGTCTCAWTAKRGCLCTCVQYHIANMCTVEHQGPAPGPQSAAACAHICIMFRQVLLQRTHALTSTLIPKPSNMLSCGGTVWRFPGILLLHRAWTRHHHELHTMAAAARCAMHKVHVPYGSVLAPCRCLRC